MDISVIIVNYNTFQLTCECISSVIAHTKGLRYELILVDNHSSDVSPEKFKEKFREIILISNSENAGFSRANNQGIKIAKGKYCLLLNSDTLLTENSMLKVFQYLESHPQTGVAGCLLTYPDGKVQHSVQQFPSVRYTLLEMLRVQKLIPSSGRLLLGPFFNYCETVSAGWIWGTFFMLRKEILQHLPGKQLDETYFMYGEDMQWCLDIRKAGYDIVFLPQTSVIHYGGASSAPKEKWMNDNLTLFMLKNYNPVHRRLIVFFQLLLKLTLRKTA